MKIHSKVRMPIRQSGFTLVELAVVVFLIGLITTMGLNALKAQLVSASIDATKKRADVIKYAMISYIAKNKRLPCPAVDKSGTESRAAAQPGCTTYYGIVPYLELGLPMTAALDGWDNFFSYAVSSKWTATFVSGGALTATTTPDPSISFNVGVNGSIPIFNRIPATQPNPGTSITPTAVFVLISGGSNGSGAYTIKGTQNAAPVGVDEITNALPQGTLPANVPIPASGFFQREYTDKDSGFGTYDDIVAWYGPNDLLSTLIQDGALQSAYGQYSNQVANIKSSVVGYVLSHACTMPVAANIPSTLSVDSWGNPLSTLAAAPFNIQFSIAGPLHCLTSLSTPFYVINNTSANQAINGPSCLDYQYLQTQCP